MTKALADAEKACELRPDWEKAHFRRGLALEELERHEEALAAYIRADELESNGEVRVERTFAQQLDPGGAPKDRTAQGQLSGAHCRRSRRRSRI